MIDLKLNILSTSATLLSSDSNYKEVVKYMQRILLISNLARHEGLLALEEYANSELPRIDSRDSFAYDAIMYIVDGTDPEIVRDLLTNRIIVDGIGGLDALINFCQMEGFLAVQQGFNPFIIKEYMKSYVPTYRALELEKFLDATVREYSKEYKNTKRDEWLAAMPVKADNIFINVFSMWTLNLSPLDLQSIVLSTDTRALGNVLIHSDRETKTRFDSIMTDASKSFMGEYLELYTEESLVKDIFEVIQAVDKLRREGHVWDGVLDFDSIFNDEQSDPFAHLSDIEKELYVARMTDEKETPMVFLGGTQNGSTWRDRVIPLLQIEWYNPVTTEITVETTEREEMYRDMASHHLYVYTPKADNIFSIAEIVDRANDNPDRVVFCALREDDNCKFNELQWESVKDLKSLLKNKGVHVFDNLSDVVTFFNNMAEE